MTSSTASLNLLNSQGDICIEIDSLPASVTLQASPSLSSGGIFPDEYPKWYVNGEEMSGEKGKASITLDVGTLVKKQDEVVITAKCSEKEVNYKSVIGSDGSITTNGNERFSSHSITFSKSSIQMTKPAGIYTSPTADTSDTDGLSYKQLDDEGKTIAEKTTIPGSNEFVFDQNKDGKLTIQFEAKVVGSKNFRESMKEGEFYFVPGELENYAAADIVWKDSKGGSAESPCVYDPEAGIVSAEVTYNKMPSSNNAFGYKTVKLMYKPKEGDVVEVTKSNYEIFFNKEGTSHPACTTCADCPNWFYYWKEGKACTLLERAQFDSTFSDTTMGEYTNNSGIIRLGKNAASDYVEKIILTWNGNKANIDCNSKGSDLRAVAIWSKHELTHELIYLEKKERINDADKDGVSNQLETTGNGISDIAIKSDPNVPDTYGLVSKFIANGMDNPAKIAEYMEKIKQTTGLKNPVELERLAKEQLRAEIDAIYSGYATYAVMNCAPESQWKVKRGRDYFQRKTGLIPEQSD